MILKNRTCIIAGLDLDESHFETENSVTNKETQDLLAVILLLYINSWYIL